MYSTKEKNKIYNDLKNEDYGEADLLLLSKAWPSHQLVKKATRDPRRYAHEVLYVLLGKVTRDDIRCNRREYSQLKEKENEVLNPTGRDHADTGGGMADNSRTDSQSGSNAEEGTGAAIGTDSAQAGSSEKEEKAIDTTIVEKLQEEIAQKDQELEQAEEQIDEAESEKEELQEELDAEREAREEAEAALEEEKKSPPTTQEPPTMQQPAETPKPAAIKSRKKTSTPTSTGETSQTETSN